MTSCFVYKIMVLTFNDRINTQLIYRFELAQVVARRIAKPQFFFIRFESHWQLFFIHVFSLGGGGGLILLFSSCHLFLFIYFFSSLAKWRISLLFTDI